MQYKKILVPIDGSEQSLRALRTALDLAHGAEDAKIFGIRIVPPIEMPTSTEYSTDPFSPTPYANMVDPETYCEFRDAAAARAKSELEEWTAEAIEGAEDRVVLGIHTHPSPATGIVEYAEENACDFIVMGSRGLGRIRSILGSVSYSVLQSAEIPVTIVK